MARQPSGAAATRTSLIASALKLFGEYGYDSVSTRQIADSAAANIGSIAYHFGGKPGLRIACVEHVITVVTEAIGTPLDQPLPANLSADQALAMLEEMFANLTRIGEQRADSEAMSTFMTREMVMPGELVDQIYSGMVTPMHDRVQQLFMAATGIAEPNEEVDLTVFTMMGQSIFFRLCKPSLVRRMNWAQIGPRETEKLVAAIVANIRAIVLHHRVAAVAVPVQLVG